jgi:hypothetical protein
LIDGPRFYVLQSEGFTSLRAWRYEHEYAVYDRLSTYAVAVFIATKGRNGHEETWRREKRENHLRARKHCAKLNREELAAVPASDAVAGVAGEAGEGLVLDDFARLRRGNDLSVPDVHDDVTRTA